MVSPAARNPGELTLNRLIKYTVETIRTRLDRLYLESIEALGNTAATNGRGHGDDVPALQDELESLYAEILPVAQMSVEEQFLGPALKSLSARNGKSLVRSAHAANYVSTKMNRASVAPT
jgi:hypothetical protein